MKGPRIGRPDRLARYGTATSAPARPVFARRPDRLRAFREATDVAEQLEWLPAALDELATRLAGVVHRARAGRRDEAADALALLALDELRDRAWGLYVAVGRAGAMQTSAQAGGEP